MMMNGLLPPRRATGVTDHGGLTGLADNDHPQYLLVTDYHPGVSAHGLLTGLSADDHTQYVLVDGTRAMTGNLRAPTVSIGGAPIAGPLLSIPVAATASSNYGEISIGAGPFDGATSGFFVGNSNGTHLAINTAAGYLGRMIDAQIAGVRMFGVGRGNQASSASATLNAIDIPAFTVAITGSTNITTAAGFNYNRLGAPTYSAALALTITNAATLAIEGAPIAGGAGPATISNAYSLWVQAGISRFDGREINTTNGAASAPALSLSGIPFAGTTTNSFPLLYLNNSAATAASTTLSTSGTAFGINSHGTPDLMNLMVDGVSKLSVDSTGLITGKSSLIVSSNLYLGGNTSNGLETVGASAFDIRVGNAVWARLISGSPNTFALGTGALTFGTSPTVSDIYVQRLAAASLQLGAAASATPIAYTLTVGESSRGGTDTNVAGANGTFASGRGTGTGAASSLIFQTPTVGSTGTTQQTLATRFTIATAASTLLNNLVMGPGAEIQGDATTTLTIGRTATNVTMFGNWNGSQDAGSPFTFAYTATRGILALGGVNRANALNGITITPQASGTAPVISATGFSDADVGIALTPKGAGNVVLNGAGVLKSYVVSALPAAVAGGLAFVTDAVATAITGLGLVVTGGGANKVVVYSDGTNWLVL